VWTIVHEPNCRHLPESYLIYLDSLKTSGLDSKDQAKVNAEIDETVRFIDRMSQIEKEINPHPTLSPATDAQGSTCYPLQVGKWRVDYYVDDVKEVAHGVRCTHNVKLPIV